MAAYTNGMGITAVILGLAVHSDGCRTLSG